MKHVSARRQPFTIDLFNVVKVRGGRFGGCLHYFKSKYNYDVRGERDRWSELSIYNTFLAIPRMIQFKLFKMTIL